MLASGAHVSIGGVDYVLATDEDNYYAHRFESLFSPTQAIAGEIAKEQIRPEKLLWATTDWSGGEGGRVFYPQDPTRYDFGSLVNATVRGQLTTRPRRYRSAVARSGSNADTGSVPAGISANRHAIIAWEDNIIVSANAVTWSAAQDAIPAMTGTSYADAISDGVNAAFLPGTGATADLIPVVQSDSSVTTWTDTQSGSVPDQPTVGCVVDGVPYTFGKDATSVLTLYKKATIMDSASDWGVTEVFSTNIAPGGTFGTDYFISCVGAETGLFFSFSTKSHAFVWECKADVARPFWTAPIGFVIRKLIYQQGILFAIGNHRAAGKQFARIWAIPLTTRSPILVASPRKHQNTQLTNFSVGCAGPDASIYVGDAEAGKIFVYDIEADALHLFDDLANGGTGDSMSFTSSSNLLTDDQFSIELDTTGWAAETNSTIARSLAQAKHGSASLLVAGVGAGACSAVTSTGSGGAPVGASTQYTASAWARTGAAGLAQAGCLVRIHWYTSAGDFISTSTGSSVTSTTTFQEVTVTATSPATAAFAAVSTQFTSGGANNDVYWDAVGLHAGSSSTLNKISFLAMHGSRLFGATHTVLGTGTSLQVFSYDDLEPDNRDRSQAISATATSAEWDNGLPMELKALLGFYVTFKVTDDTTESGLVANSQITVSYSIDDADYVALDTITSLTTPRIPGVLGHVFLPVSTGEETVKYSRMKLRITLDNNATAGVAPPVLFGVTSESQLLAYAETWDLVLRVEDEEQNERPVNRQNSASYIRDQLDQLAINKNLVTFLDGADDPIPDSYTTHTVVVEDPVHIINDVRGGGLSRIKLRSIG